MRRIVTAFFLFGILGAGCGIFYPDFRLAAANHTNHEILIFVSGVDGRRPTLGTVPPGSVGQWKNIGIASIPCGNYGPSYGCGRDYTQASVWAKDLVSGRLSVPRNVTFYDRAEQSVDFYAGDFTQ